MKVHKDSVNSVDKAIENTALVCLKFYGNFIRNSIVTTKKLGLYNESSTDTYSKINILSENDNIDRNMGDLKSKSSTGDITIENLQLPNMHWLLKMHYLKTITRFKSCRTINQ